MSPVDGGMPFEFYHDYSYDGFMRSYEDSIQRLGTGDIDMLSIHDLDLNHFTPTQEEGHLAQLASSGWRALEELKQTGAIKAYGSGINRVDTVAKMLDACPSIDFLLLSQRYTLGDHSAIEDAMPMCEQGGVGVIAGTVFNGGIMHTGAQPGAVFNYELASAAQLQHVGRIEVVCAKHGIPLAAAALQFPLHHPLVPTAVVRREIDR
jgi:D-threo-aldose 1-dehydrogenase